MQYHVLNPDVTPAIQPPLEMVMPATAQTAWEIIAGLIVLWTIYYFVKESRRIGSLFPLLFWLGTFMLAFAEPIIDIGMGCFYPHVGQNTAFELYGREMPLFLFLCYLGGIAPVMYAFGMKIAEGASSSYIWKAFIIMGIGTGIYELITINLGLWTYYSIHSFRIFNYPPVIGFMNGASFLLTSLAVAKFYPLLKGKRQFMAIFILPVVFMGAEFATGWPVYSTSHTVASIEYPILSWLGTLVSIFFALLVAWWVVELSATDKTDKNAQNSSENNSAEKGFSGA